MTSGILVHITYCFDGGVSNLFKTQIVDCASLHSTNEAIMVMFYFIQSLKKLTEKNF